MKRHRVRLFVGLVIALPVLGFVALCVGLEDWQLHGLVHMRVARILLAAVVGASLAVSGTVFQAVLRNPLADPYVLGVSAGGGLGAAAVHLLGSWIAGPALYGQWSLPIAAFVGSLLTMLFVYNLARVGNRVPVHTLLLAGVVVGAVFGSMLMFLVSFMPARQLHSLMGWLLGNLAQDNRLLVELVIATSVLGIGFTVLLARDLNVMVLGEEAAAHLGVDVERAKRTFFVLASLMTGATVAACGLIGFVGLIVPHVVRMMIGPDHRYLVPTAALFGGAFLIVADFIARSVMPPQEVPIGVITAFVGGPFFLYLLRSRRRAYWG